jgi:hypothetical protein
MPRLRAAILRSSWGLSVFLCNFVLALLPKWRLTGNGPRDILAGMVTVAAQHSNVSSDRKRLLLSLAGAVLISAAGFGMIIWITSAHWLMFAEWLYRLYHMGLMILLPILSFFASLIITRWGTRKQREMQKRNANPRQPVLPL